MSKLTSFVVVALTALVGSADATVCRLPGLNGYEIAAARAKQYLPPTTSNISEMAVYIERDPNGSFYFHSNFKSEGADHPTKIGGEPDIVDLENALINIVFTEFPSRAEQTALRRAMLKDVKIFVNPDVFDGDGTTK